jgi:hypothetical protein
MNSMRKTILPILVATLWISLSEFARNELVLRSYWIAHYERLGLLFPSDPVNGAIWGLWSLLCAITIFLISKRFGLVETTFLAWFALFVTMWVVIGNLGVLPDGLLYIASPWSLVEAFVAALIIKKMS